MEMEKNNETLANTLANTVDNTVGNTVDKDENLKTLEKDFNENTNHNNDDEIRKFMNEIRPLYPPLVITPELLMPKLPSSTSTRKFSGSNKRKKDSNVKFPNAFIAYRMEFCKQLKNKRICLTMQDVSYFASKLWRKEPCDVKKAYTRLANDAKLLYEKRKKELLLAEEQRQQIEQSNSTDIPSLSLNPLDTQQILQYHPIETTTISPQLQISPDLYVFPAVSAADQFNVSFNSYENVNITQPFIPSQSYLYYSLWYNSFKPSYD